MANDGNYRELRWFTSWARDGLDACALPPIVTAVTGEFESFGIKEEKNMT
jgi:hypothetical protein